MKTVGSWWVYWSQAKAPHFSHKGSSPNRALRAWAGLKQVMKHSRESEELQVYKCSMWQDALKGLNLLSWRRFFHRNHLLTSEDRTYWRQLVHIPTSFKSSSAQATTQQDVFIVFANWKELWRHTQPAEHPSTPNKLKRPTRPDKAAATSAFPRLSAPYLATAMNCFMALSRKLKMFEHFTYAVVFTYQSQGAPSSFPRHFPSTWPSQAKAKMSQQARAPQVTKWLRIF